jgi:hypothetical protein
MKIEYFKDGWYRITTGTTIGYFNPKLLLYTAYDDLNTGVIHEEYWAKKVAEYAKKLRIEKFHKELSKVLE